MKGRGIKFTVRKSSSFKPPRKKEKTDSVQSKQHGAFCDSVHSAGGFAVKEQGLVLEDCTASGSLDEMRPHRMGGLIDGWAARSWTRDLLVASA